MQHYASAQPILYALMRAVANSLSDLWIYDGNDSPPPEVAGLSEKWGETLAAWLRQFAPTYSQQTGAPLADRVEEWALQRVRGRSVEDTAELLLYGGELLARARDEHVVWRAELVVTQDKELWDDLAASWGRRAGRIDPELRAYVEAEELALTEAEEIAIDWIAVPLAAISDVSQAPISELLLAKIVRKSFGATGVRAEQFAGELDSRAREFLRQLYGDAC